MKPLIVRTDRDVQIAEGRRQELLDLGDLVTCDDDAEETISAAASKADILLTCYAPITRHVIQSAPKLKGIVKYGVGVDSIDLDAAAQRGIYVANCPDYGSETVGEHAFALMMALARKLPTIAHHMRDDGWTWPTPPVLGSDLHQKTLGIVGLGRIGSVVARRAIAFGMRVLAYDPYIDPGKFHQLGAEPVSLEQLLDAADFVSLHCVLTAETRGILGEAQLRSMKRSAYVINVSRGALIDEPALVRALQEGWIAGGGFDVFISEPLTRDYPLAGLDNVILTPHLAWYTADALDRLDADTLSATREILSGQVPRRLKNGDLLNRYRTAGAAH